MITLLLGENSFEIEQALSSIIDEFDGKVERIKAEDLQISQLPDILMGVSLFANKRLILIRNLSENKVIWPVFGDWLSKVSDDIHLVLVETKLDKRSTTYKTLKQLVDVREFLPWSDRDIYKAEKWTIEKAQKIGIKLDNKLAQFILRRVGVDQWRIYSALEKLALVEVISEDVIKDVIEPNPVENVFELLETAIKGNTNLLEGKITILKQTEDVYKLSALLFSQAFQLLAIAIGGQEGKSHDDISKDFAIHPFVLSKLSAIAKDAGKNKLSKMIKIFAKTDEGMKSSKSEPWVLLEYALFQIANL